MERERRAVVLENKEGGGTFRSGERGVCGDDVLYERRIFQKTKEKYFTSQMIV